MEQKWTAEPWRANSYRSGNDIAWEVRSDSGAITGWGQVTQTEANAKRIASCVNALQGIADPSAVSELVKAAEGALSYIEHPEGKEPNGLRMISTMEMLRDALSRLKGTA